MHGVSFRIAMNVSPAQIGRCILMEVSQKLLIQKSGWFIRKYQPIFTLDGLFVSTKKFSPLCSPYPFQGSILVGALLTFVQHDNCPAFLYLRYPQITFIRDCSPTRFHEKNHGRHPKWWFHHPWFHPFFKLRPHGYNLEAVVPEGGVFEKIHD